MALDPFVSWTFKPASEDTADPEAVIEATEWAIGVVDAGTTSATTVFLIWNNWKESTEVRKTMEDCKIGTRTKLGSETGEGEEVVKNQWVEVRSQSSGDTPETPFSPLGYSEVASQFVEKDIKGHGMSDFEIAGVLNDGSYADGFAKGNFAEVELQASPPIDASSGPKEFYTRVFYIFV